jgi:DNA sulfur modification protein DndC
MEAALKGLRERTGEKLLMMTGVRMGESAQRDARIVGSCSKDGAECGQGWLHLSPDKKSEGNINQYFIPSGPDGITDTLAPILHWRVCHVWDWLMFHAPDLGFPTIEIAEAYGGDEAQEINARTGCVGCNLASKDTALEAVLRIPRWQYLAPLKRLRPLYAELTLFHNRLRKFMETNKDGSMAANQGRRGPLTMEARRMGLAEVLSVQREINEAAKGMPEVSLINEEEELRILELIDANTWPNGWSGLEDLGTVQRDEYYRDGSIQPLMFGE